jgi:nucleoside-diphosphate-sugar epimerase
MTDSPVPSGPAPVDTIVFGASGFIGRWLLLELVEQGRTVAVAVRGGEERAQWLRRWLRNHGTDDQTLTVVEADIRREGLGLADSADAVLTSVRDVFNAAGRYQFGITREDARLANVDGAVNVLRWAARPRLRRLVHVSGYRVSKPDTPYPLPAGELAGLYRRLGAYEASKIEGDAALRAAATQESVPLTLVNPSTVVGHSITGDAEQYIGLATSIHDLWNGSLPALAGTRQTYVPGSRSRLPGTVHGSRAAARRGHLPGSLGPGRGNT